MADGFSVDTSALQGLVGVHRDRAAAGSADFGLGRSPDVGRSSDGTRAALGALARAAVDMSGSLGLLADSLQASIGAYLHDDDAVASAFGASGAAEPQ